jgi:hypothetical protein
MQQGYRDIIGAAARESDIRERAGRYRSVAAKTTQDMH